MALGHELFHHLYACASDCADLDYWRKSVPASDGDHIAWFSQLFQAVVCWARGVDPSIDPRGSEAVQLEAQAARPIYIGIPVRSRDEFIDEWAGALGRDFCDDQSLSGMGRGVLGRAIAFSGAARDPGAGDWVRGRWDGVCTVVHLGIGDEPAAQQAALRVCRLRVCYELSARRLETGGVYVAWVSGWCLDGGFVNRGVDPVEIEIDTTDKRYTDELDRYRAGFGNDQPPFDWRDSPAPHAHWGC